MRSEASYGIIPLRKSETLWEVLLIQRIEGFWEFPKGHGEKGEVPFESACRELQEETALTVTSCLFPEPLQIEYTFSYKSERIHKAVFYFLALVEGDPFPQPEEVKNCEWMTLEKARDRVTFSNSKVLCDQVTAILKKSV